MMSTICQKYVKYFASTDPLGSACRDIYLKSYLSLCNSLVMAESPGRVRPGSPRTEFTGCDRQRRSRQQTSDRFLHLSGVAGWQVSCATAEALLALSKVASY